MHGTYQECFAGILIRSVTLWWLCGSSYHLFIKQPNVKISQNKMSSRLKSMPNKQKQIIPYINVVNVLLWLLITL